MKWVEGIISGGQGGGVFFHRDDDLFFFFFLFFVQDRREGYACGGMGGGMVHEGGGLQLLTCLLANSWPLLGTTCGDWNILGSDGACLPYRTTPVRGSVQYYCT